MKKLSLFIALLLFSNGLLFSQVGINANNGAPDASAGLDVNFNNKGFLPPRMTTDQRNTIASPAEGLVIYNTDEKALNVYNGTAWMSMIPTQRFVCGLTITINHGVSGGVSPVNKTVVYGTVNGIPGELTKCWITSNLGSDHQATAVSDDSEASAGWYWQFNRKQGYTHDGWTVTPAWAITSISESSDWIPANDPCALELAAGWRIPTITEWNNVSNAGNWTTWDAPWNSGLKLHAAGYLYNSDGSLISRGSNGNYWCSTQYDATSAFYMTFDSGSSYLYNNDKAYGFSVRCVRDY